MAWLPIDTESGSVSNGLYQVTFGPYNTPRILMWISLIGPASSTVNVYLDTTFVDTTARGDFNRADYYSGIPIAQGRVLYLYWNVGTGTLPMASIGMTTGIIEPDL